MSSIVHHVNKLLCTIRGSIAVTLTKASPLHHFVQFLVLGAAAPTDGCKVDRTLYHRLIKDMQHLAEDIERPKFSQQVKTVLFLLEDSFNNFQSSLSFRQTHRYFSSTSTSSPRIVIVVFFYSCSS